MPQANTSTGVKRCIHLCIQVAELCLFEKVMTGKGEGESRKDVASSKGILAGRYILGNTISTSPEARTLLKLFLPCTPGKTFLCPLNWVRGLSL